MGSIISEDQIHLFDQMPTASGCKDLESKFIYANENYGKIIGLDHHRDVIGRTDFDMPCDTVKCAEMFRAQDFEVISKALPMRILDVHPFAGGEWKAYVFSKAPFKDRSGKVIGTIFSGQDITNASTIELASMLSRVKLEGISSDLLGQSSYMLGTNFGTVNLTVRESEVLFFVLRGKTAKLIGKALGISARTVEDYIVALRAKFCAGSKLELIDKAIEKGYLNYIPEAVLSTQMSLALGID